MTDNEFINSEEIFKRALRDFISDCIEFDVDVRDRVLDCVHNAFEDNDLEGLS